MKWLAIFLLCFALRANSFAQTPSLAEQYLFAAANADRAAHHLSPLELDPTLSRAAATHARQMAEHQTISHRFTGEPALAERVAAAGSHFSLVTENVAEAADSVVIHDLWMRSPGHRANLLDPQVTAVGISVVVRQDQFYAVEDFARIVPSLTLTQQEAAVAHLLEQTGVPVEPVTQDARATCRMATGYTGARQPWFTMRYTSADLKVLPAQLVERLASGTYHRAAVGACSARPANSPFSGYTIAVLLYP